MLANRSDSGNPIIGFFANRDFVAFECILISKHAIQRAAHDRMVICNDRSSLCPECQSVPLLLVYALSRLMLAMQIAKNRYHKAARC